MRNKNGKMICPRCAEEMNHHGDKLVYNDMAGAGPMDRTMSEHIEKFHTCPQCGAGASCAHLRSPSSI